MAQPSASNLAQSHHNNCASSGKQPERGFTPGPAAGQFEIFEWHPAYQSCQRYFLDHAQHDDSVLAVSALINIALPHQWHSNPIKTSEPADEAPAANPFQPDIPSFKRRKQEPIHRPVPPIWVSLVPYIRRLVVTGFDRDPVLHGFFGEDWRKGIGPVQECERRNYLFAAKSGGWSQVKAQYDMGPQESVPFLQPPQNINVTEIENAEKLWSQWLATEDWMIGPRAPAAMEDYSRSEPRSAENSRH